MENYPLCILYDHSCPLCRLEIENLMARNHAGKLQFIDISPVQFKQDAVKLFGIEQSELMRIIYAIKPDGSRVSGVEVFRLAYGAVGLGWITTPTAWPGLKTLCDWAYPHIARNRYRISANFSSLLISIAARRAEKRSKACKNGACTYHQPNLPKQSYPLKKCKNYQKIPGNIFQQPMIVRLVLFYIRIKIIDSREIRKPHENTYLRRKWLPWPSPHCCLRTGRPYGCCRSA